MKFYQTSLYCAKVVGRGGRETEEAGFLYRHQHSIGEAHREAEEHSNTIEILRGKLHGIIFL